MSAMVSPHDTGASGSGSGAVLARMRVLLLVVLFVAMSGVVLELVLLEHYEDRIQWVPLVALGVSLLAVAVVLVRATRATMRLLQVVSLALIAVAVAGIYFHYTGNAEFEREMYPDLAGRKLVWQSLTGATPALAPGTFVLLGLIGLIAGYRHPALRRGSHQEEDR